MLRAAGKLAAAHALLAGAVEWFAGSGGGEGALSARCSLAAMDAVDGLDRDGERLTALLAEARRTGDHESEVLVLDALARLHATADIGGAVRSARAGELLADADAAMAQARHALAESDRLDAVEARRLLDSVQVRPR